MVADPTGRLSIASLGTRNTRRWEDWTSTPAVAPVPSSKHPARHREPVDLVEQVLVDIFAQALNAGTVGVRDSFFDLGGDSLAATRAIAAVNAAFDIQLPVNTLLDAPSVESLSKHVNWHASKVEKSGGEHGQRR
nr:acyl carrier protein [Mycolicibacterium komanii]